MADLDQGGLEREAAGALPAGEADSGIPFNRPAFTGNELLYFAEALRRHHLSAAGTFTGRCSRILAEELGAAAVFLTTSCTAALEAAAALLDPEPGDEVLLPSFTFVSTAGAFARHRMRPVFVDVRRDTLNLDESLLERRITRRTRAIVPVHYAGVGCEMDSIAAIAERHGLCVVEDAAHAFLGRYRDRPLGGIGRMATLSFHETKNFTCGEGGALVVQSPDLVARARVFVDKGTDRDAMRRGLTDRYAWVGPGSNAQPSELLAAVLLGQLEQRAAIQRRRRALWETYAERLEGWAAAWRIRLPVVPADCQQAYHLFYLLAADAAQRDRLLAHLRKQRVQAVFHYLPLHLSPMGRRFGGRPGDCPVTEDVSARLVRLPLFTDLGDDEQALVVAALETFPG